MGPVGFRLHAGYLDAWTRAAIIAEVFATTRTAPFYRSVTPGGKPMSVQTTNLGPVGWVSDVSGYRYQDTHPLTGRPWPPVPESLLEIWRALAGPGVDADCCLVNLYRDGARMGAHQDRDEADFSFPVVSISLGDTAIFRIGGVDRRGPTRSLRLASGDVCVLAGEDRVAYHGVDRVLANSSSEVPGGGRLNLTLRRARSA